MIILNAQRIVEVRVRGSHAPPNAEEQAREMLKKCCSQRARHLRTNITITFAQKNEVKESHLMAEEIINSYKHLG